MNQNVKLAVLIVASSLMTGCAQMSGATQSLTSGSNAGKSAAQRISRIVCLWEPAEGVGSDGRPNRGFLGQVLFFEAGSDQPVLVDGDVEIYTFDDQGTPEQQSRPLRKFSYTSAEWNQLATESAVGVGYNVAVPYVRKSQYETVCALRVKFTSRSGVVAYSGLDSVTLRGKDNPNSLSMERTRSKLSAHELLEEQFGDLVKKQGSKTETKQTVGDTTIERTAKTDNSLETLTIRRPSKRISPLEARRQAIATAKVRKRLGLDSQSDQLSETGFVPAP